MARVLNRESTPRSSVLGKPTVPDLVNKLQASFTGSKSPLLCAYLELDVSGP